MLELSRGLSMLRLALILILGSLWFSNTKAELLLKDGDRVVFYGDSITEQRLYTRYIQDYLHCRYPEMKLKFYNAGWSGDVAPGGLRRLDRDVLPLNPTVVTLFFGMNDGMYQPVSDFAVKTYSDAMESLIKALQAKGIRVIVFGPGCVDPDRRADLKAKDYNGTLKALSDAALKLADTYKCPSGDIHTPMLAFLDAEKAKNAGFFMTQDAIHPNEQGALVVAHLMLQTLGAEPMAPLGSADLTSGKEDGIHVVSKSPTQVVVETIAPSPVPFWFEPTSIQVMRDSGFLDLAGQKLTITGMPPGAYRLTVRDMVLNQISADALARGVEIPGSFSKQGQTLDNFTARKDDTYFSTWRGVALQIGDQAQAKPIVDALMKVDDAFDEAIMKVLQTTEKTTVTINQIAPDSNLALHAPYVCSDPNMFGYGAGALTDGSWVADQVHCFATGVTDAFPKTVTVDLSAPVKVGRVVFGVPPYGATKTVNVSISKDGKDYTDVGSYVFSTKKEERTTISFTPTEAQYIRLTYPDHYADGVNMPVTFAFTTELEAYADSAAPTPTPAPDK